MQIEKTLDDGILTLKVSGRLDTNTAPDLEAELPPAGETGVRGIVFDVAELDYISSAGLRVLLSAQKRLSAAGGGKVAVASPNEVVKGVLDMTGCSEIFDMR